ncbi:hypothetical protein E1091_15865 [Micromonospora fluostatini]|uniref:Uncharacterized protein n=1 Tax=Micromonospora fluostatini TaxID=1629071 RepID=A0ABY2DDS8_9ACTN|nr:hypothetical protein E1091_15865 [Micromonospora fluostatini]
MTPTESMAHGVALLTLVQQGEIDAFNGLVAREPEAAIPGLVAVALALLETTALHTARTPERVPARCPAAG